MIALTACSDDGGDSDSPGGDRSEAAASESEQAHESATANGDVTVSARGANPMGLTTTDTPPDAEEDTYTAYGQLAVGPGSCFAFRETGARGGDNNPRPLVFPEDTNFTNEGDQSAVEIPGGELTAVGDDMVLDVVSMQLGDLKGLPDACAQGASQTGMIVQGVHEGE